MKRSEYQPGAAGDAEAIRDGDRWVLVFVREMKHPPERVWRALTDPAQLAEWAPFDADRNLSAPGDVTLTMAGGDGTEQDAASVLRADAPLVLEYTWGGDVIRWELEPVGWAATRLTLRHTMGNADWLPKTVAGWHICLDVADAFMSDDPIGRIVGMDAREHGWERLNHAYATQLGMEDTGWPL